MHLQIQVFSFCPGKALLPGAGFILFAHLTEVGIATRAVKIPVLEGRDFRDEDTPESLSYVLLEDLPELELSAASEAGRSAL